jgi:hypothetical protein
MTEFETPRIRDITKLIPSVLLGLLIAIGIMIFFIFQFNLTVYGDHCSITTSYSIAKWVLESLTVQC